MKIELALALDETIPVSGSIHVVLKHQRVFVKLLRAVLV